MTGIMVSIEDAGRRKAQERQGALQRERQQRAEALRAARRAPVTPADLRAALGPLAVHTDRDVRESAQEALRLMESIEDGALGRRGDALDALITLALRGRIGRGRGVGRLWIPVHQLSHRLRDQRRTS